MWFLKANIFLSYQKIFEANSMNSEVDIFPKVDLVTLGGGKFCNIKKNCETLFYSM